MSKDTPVMKTKSKIKIILSGLIVAIIVTMIALAFILNPSLSPLSSIHDADGDRAADSIDASPADSQNWSFGYSIIEIAFENPIPYSFGSFQIRILDNLICHGSFMDNFTSFSTFINYTYLIGAKNSTNVSILISVSNTYEILQGSKNLTLYDAGKYLVSIEDFVVIAY